MFRAQSTRTSSGEIGAEKEPLGGDLYLSPLYYPKVLGGV